MANRQILLLGSPRIEANGQRIHIGRRKALALLAYLVVSRQRFSREDLATLLWADVELSRGLAYLRTTLWTLNQALGDDAITLDGDTVAFNEAAGITDDVAQFRHYLTIDYRAEAAELYRGELLAGFTLPDAPAFEEWLFFQRESLQRELINALAKLSEQQRQRGHYELATVTVRRWLALDEFNEAAHRLLMELYAQAGQKAAALRQYQELTRLLQTELQVAPEPETTALYESIQNQRTAAPVSLSPFPEPENPPEFAPPKSPVSALPAQTTPFFGRDNELQEIARLLADPDCRLLTIIGPGGIGKTRLVLQAASQVQYGEGAYFVNLAPVLSSESLMRAILEAFDCYLEVNGNVRQTLQAYLRDKDLLLVLDNFEHLIAGAEALSSILEAAPGVKLLVTSRERLNLREEWLLELRGLDYPRTEDAATLENYSAVRLFLQGARHVRPNFALHNGDVAAVVRICRLVDGMPLGLELAAAWVKLLPVTEIAAEIQRNLDFLSTSLRNIPERHRSLRAVFEHSWAGLSEAEQACLRRLTVFRGPFNLQAAQKVSWASLHLLLALTDKSLIRLKLDGRYEMHELLRQFAEGKLSPEEYQQVHDEHAAYYAGWLAELIRLLKCERQPEALDLIQKAMDDIRIAWRWAIDQRQWELIANSMEALMHYALARYRIRDLRALIEAAVSVLDREASSPAERLLLARLLAAQANVVRVTVGYDKVFPLIQRCQSMLAEFAGHPDTAIALISLGAMRSPPDRKDDISEGILWEGLAVAEATNQLWAVAYAHLCLGWLMQNRIRYAGAREMFLKALALFRQTGQPWGQASALDGLEENYRTLGDHELANEALHAIVPLVEAFDADSMWLVNLKARINHYLDANTYAPQMANAIKAARDAGDKSQIAWMLYHDAWLRIVHDDYAGVEDSLKESIKLFQELSDLEGEVWCWIYLGVVALQQHHDFATARKHAYTAKQRVGDAHFPWGIAGAHYLLGDVALAERDVETARDHYVEAVKIAVDAQSALQILRHLAGIVTVLAFQQDTDNARLIAAYIQQHPITSQDVRRRVKRLLAESGEATSELLEQVKALTTDEVVALALKLVGEQVEP